MPCRAGGDIRSAILPLWGPQSSVYGRRAGLSSGQMAKKCIALQWQMMSLRWLQIERDGYKNKRS